MIKKDNFLTKLPVMEKFYTIQGEGYYSGQPFYFIRLGGCDVGCHWCDVKESWDHNQHQFIEVDDLIKDVKEYTSNVVITGGEPLMWDLSEFTKRFKENNIKLHLETSGAYEMSGNWDWVCLSPKKKMLPKQEIYSKANEIQNIGGKAPALPKYSGCRENHLQIWGAQRVHRYRTHGDFSHRLRRMSGNIGTHGTLQRAGDECTQPDS